MRKAEKSHKLFHNLKSQGLSLNVVIIAAIVLIVLIVLWAIFTGRMGGFSTGLTGTQKCSDVCEALGKGTPESGGACVSGSGDYVGQYADPTGKKLETCCCS